MWKLLLIGGGILFASKVYSNRLKKINTQTKKKVATREDQIDALEE